MDKNELLLKSLELIVNNHKQMVEGGIADKKELKEVVSRCFAALNRVSDDMAGVLSQPQLPFHTQVDSTTKSAEQPKKTVVPDNKPAKATTENTVDEPNKNELATDETDDERTKRAAEERETSINYIKKCLSEKDYANVYSNLKAELGATPDDPDFLALNEELKTLAPDLFKTEEETEEKKVNDADLRRMTLEDATENLKSMMLEDFEAGAVFGNKTLRKKYNTEMLETWPIDTPEAKSNNDKARNKTMDEIMRAVNKARKEKLDEDVKKQKESAEKQVTNTIAEAEEFLKKTEPAKTVVELTKLPENTKTVTAKELEIGKADEEKQSEEDKQPKETKVVEMNNAETDLVNCTLAEFKKEIEKDYDGIIADEEFSSTSDRFKKWEAATNARKDNPDSKNIVNSSDKPNRAANFIKTVLGQIKVNNQRKAKKSA